MTIYIKDQPVFLKKMTSQKKTQTSFFLCPVFPKLVQTINGGLHMMVILFLMVAMAFALVSLSFCIYNARKVPYQSIKGHKGIYLWNCIAGMRSHTCSYCFQFCMFIYMLKSELLTITLSF